MTPPRICPPPPTAPDCGLFDQRLSYVPDEPLRRAVLMDRRKSRDLAAFVWADFNRDRRPVAEPKAPTPTVPPLPRPALPSTSMIEKGVLR
ncbi:MAG TPA: hypothetical protein VLL27_13520 [Solirubrobacterales bacterium]|nr:hypothetical protein [Solirubrobacterales bacterium]